MNKHHNTVGWVSAQHVTQRLGRLLCNIGLHLDPSYKQKILTENPQMAKVINVDEIKVIDTSKPLEEQEFIKEQYDIETYPFLSLKIDTFEQLEYLFKEIKKNELISKEGRSTFIYRGQKNSDWFLQCSLEREAKTYGIDVGWCITDHFKVFTNLLRGKLSDHSVLKNTFSIEEKNEIWAIGQHLGLKTLLLDWTKIFYIALFFAFEKELEDKESLEYRAVYRIDTFSLEQPVGLVDFYYNPYSDQIGRITAQQGTFTTYQAIEVLMGEERRIEQDGISETDKYKCKIRNAIKLYIKNELREEIISHLSHLGIRFETIYPDLQGAVLEANYQLERKLKTIKSRRDARQKETDN